MSRVAGPNVQQQRVSNHAPAPPVAPVLCAAGEASQAAEALLADLRTAAQSTDHAFGTEHWGASAFRQVFADWLSSFTYIRMDAAERSAMSPVIWLIARHHPRLDASPRSAPLIAVALNPQRRRIVPITGPGKGVTVPELAADAGKLIDFVERIAAARPPHRIRIAPSLPSLQTAVSGLHRRLMESADDLLELVTEGARLRAPMHAALVPTARALMQAHLKSLRVALNADIENTIKRDIARWAEQLVCTRLQTTPLAVYNHILQAPTDIAQRWRMGAVDLLSEARHLHLSDQALWQRVDQGRPPHEILAPLLGVQPASLRIALNRSKSLSWRYLSRIVPWLDGLDPNQWPDTADDRYAFDTAVRMAEASAKAFAREPRSFLSDWKRHAGATPWFELVAAKLARHAEINDHDVNPGMPPRAAMSFRSAQFVTDVQNIDHMRSDINRRLIYAGVRCEADRHGASPQQQADAAHRVGRALATQLWSEAGPSEQMLISAHWHAARRLWLAPPVPTSTNSSSLSRWRTLIDAPLHLDCGVVVHPLDTAAKLREEGGAMQHCVGSMSMECRLGSTHIFSLRGADGRRLSTLSIDSNFRARNGSRRIALRQNLAVRNTGPPVRAVQAASAFIARINATDLLPGVLPIAVDWTAIDASRQPPRRSDALDRQEFGFAIHDADAQAAATHFLWPFLPRRLKSRARSIAGNARVTFVDLSAAAGIPEAMSVWWLGRNR